MSGTQAAEAALVALLGPWTPPGTKPPVLYENVGEEKPAECVEVTVRTGDSVNVSPQAGLGFVRSGLLVLRINTAPGKGRGRALELRDSLTPLFENVELTVAATGDRVLLREEQTDFEGEDGPHYAIQVAFPFERDEV